MAAILLVSSLLMSACRGMELENKTEQVEGYTKEQAMIVVANERNRYQNVYTSAIWNVQFGEDNTSFEEHMIQNVKVFLEQVTTLNMLAAERGITVTSQERDRIRTLSEQYMNGLSEADRAYIGCDISDVQKVYTDYFLANKLASVLTSTADSEISDSEAKIIHVEQIVTASLPKAKALLKKAKIEGDDFGTLARRYSESDEVERVLRRGVSENVYERTAFGLDEGEISNIVELDGLYYIIKCTNGYDEAATLMRKDKLETAILDRAFMEVYEPYRAEHNIRFAESFWKRIDFSEGEDSAVTNFFELYHEMLAEE